MAFIITNTGATKLASAEASGPALDIVTAVVGDGGGSTTTPDAADTALVNQVWSGAINRIFVHPTLVGVVVVEFYIDGDAGPFTVREVGLIDSGGDLLYIGNYPESYKPDPASGNAEDKTIQIHLGIANASTINLTVNPAAMVTLSDFGDHLALASTETVVGHVELATAAETTAGTDSTRAVHPAGLKVELDKKETPAGAQGRVDTHAALTSPHSATSAATASRLMLRDANGRAKIATPSAADDIARKDTVDAHANRTDNPHNVSAAQIGLAGASTTAQGIVELATSAEALAGADTTRAVTAAGLASAKLYASNGYQKLPGGLIIQWGSASVGSGALVTVTLPLAFPTDCLQCIASLADSPGGEDPSASGIRLSASQIRLHQSAENGSTHLLSWWAVGY